MYSPILRTCKPLERLPIYMESPYPAITLFPIMSYIVYSY